MNVINIRTAKYDKTGQANNFIVAIINNVSVNVPIDPMNTEYAEIIRQVASGNLTIEPAD